MDYGKDGKKEGVIFDSSTPRGKKKNIVDCLTIQAYEDGFILNKDGSMSVGFEMTLFEEEFLNEDDFISVINAVSDACKRLPIGTVVQKMDIYYEDKTYIDIADELPFFYKKTLEHHDHKITLKHRSVLFLRFRINELTPLISPLAAYTWNFKEPFLNPDELRSTVESYIQEFVSFLPSGLELKRLDDKQNKELLFQYTSLTFDRQPLGFESDMVVSNDKLVANGYVKSVRAAEQPKEGYCFLKNNLGAQGVTSTFMWPLTHYARFPHIICQQIEIINDENFRKSKSIDLHFSAQLQLGRRSQELSEHVNERFKELEKELLDRGSKIVKTSYNVIVWAEDEKLLQARTNYIKSAFGKIGILAAEEGGNTAETFFSNVPGGAGFNNGMHMPIETAVSFLNFVTPRRGDGKGIFLANRQGDPICYNPFKEELDNQHAFVFGPSGSGKSFFNGKMIKDRYYLGHTMIVIDSGGTYRNLFKALSGKYIEYNQGQDLNLNPFIIPRPTGGHFKDFEEDFRDYKIPFLVNFIAKIWKGDLLRNPLTPAENALLSKFIKLYYGSLSTSSVPTLIDFCSWVEQYVAKDNIDKELFDIRNFIIVLEPFTHGIYKYQFNSLEPPVNLGNEKLLCFELEAVKNNAQLYPLVIAVVFDYVLQLVSLQPREKKFIDIEEGWTMLDDSSQDYIEAFFRKGRKSNTSIRIITQDIDEIKNSNIAGAMKNNSSSYILLYNDKESVRKDIAEFLGMNDFDSEKYASLMRKNSYLGGFREIFIKEMDKSSVWRVEVSLLEHAILTSRPAERNAIVELTKKTGDIKLAACEWAENVIKEERKYV